MILELSVQRNRSSSDQSQIGYQILVVVALIFPLFLRLILIKFMSFHSDPRTVQ